MAASTGPDSNLYQIPEVELGDTFNVWRDTTNTQTYKLNKLKVYDGVSSSTIEMTVSDGGTFSAVLADNIGKGVTFLNPVVFSSGVTFNGDVTFNATTFTVNANAVTIDDYAIVLGDTAGVTDALINAEGGGGILLKRGGGVTAEWVWRGTFVHGITGMWQANAHIGFSGATFGLVPQSNGVLPVHGSGLRIDGGGTAEHGLQINLTTASGTSTDRDIDFVRYAPEGSTAFMSVLGGSTHSARPFVRISDGVNRKTIAKTGHGFVFGTPIRANGSDWAAAEADSAENAEVVGIVSRVIDLNNFELTFIGEIFGPFTSVTEDGGNLSTGRTYYLSPYNAGKITVTQPTASGSVHKAVLVATSPTSAVVIPFTGGVLASPLTIANASSVSTQINQVNRFRIGDVVRFKEYQTVGGVTLSYTVGSGQTLEGFYPDGIYVKAQANTSEEAEVAGMVVQVNGATGSGTQAYTSFNILMDGFFDVTFPTSVTPGSVYFLNTSCAGSSGAFESGTDSYTTSPPSSEGTVRKPLFMATGSGTGYLFSYRGDVRGAATGVTYADLADFLVQDILSGVCGDLVIGVFNNTTGGKETIRLSTGSEQSNAATRGACGGYMGVGGGWAAWSSGSNTTNKILANLDLNGILRVGKTLGTTPVGQDLIVVRGNGDAAGGVTMESRLVIGVDHTDTSLVIGRGVRPNPAAAGYNSSIGGALDRVALVIGASGNAGPSLRWRTAANNTTAVGGNVALADVFSIVGNTMRMRGQVAISDTGNYPTNTSTLVYNRVIIGGTTPNILVWNEGQATAAGNYAQLGLGTKSPGSATMLSGAFIHGGNENTSDGSGFLAFNVTDTAGSSNVERMRINSSGNLGIGTATPGTRLDIHFNTNHGSDTSLSTNFAGGLAISNNNQVSNSGNKCGLRLSTRNDGDGTSPYGSFIDIIAKQNDNDSNDLLICSEYYGTSAASTPTTPILTLRGAQGTIVYNSAEMPRPSGSAPLFAVRAWGKITPNGANNPSAVAGGNVASVVRQSSGVLRVTLTTAMPDTNYSVVASCVGQTITNVNLRSTVCTEVINSSTFDLRHGLANTSTSTDFSSANIISFMVIR